MLDAARAWAERQFRRGMIARTGTEVLVRCETDPTPPRPAHAPASVAARSNALTATTYQVKLTIVSAPAFRASLVGVVHEVPHDSNPGGSDG